MPVTAVAAIGEAVADISIADVGIGAAIGGLEAGLTGGNILEGAAFGGLTGGIADVGSSLYSAAGGISGIGDSIGGAFSDAGNSISNIFSGGTDASGFEAGGALQDAGTNAATNLSSTGGAISGTTPGVSGAATGGGFTAPSSQLATGADPAISSQLGGTEAVAGATTPGATTPGATSLGSVGGDTGSNFSGINKIGQDFSEPGTADNFTGGSGSIGAPSNPGVESASGGGSSGFTTGGGLPGAGGPQVGQLTGPTDSLGVPGGVAPTASTGATNLTSSLSTSSGSSGLGDQVSNFFNNSSNLKYALPAGELVNTLISGPQKLPSNAQPLEAGGAVEGPLQQTEQQSLNAYNSQTLTPGQQAQVDQYVQGAQNALYQQLAGSGVTNPNQDSRFIQGMQQIQQQAQAMKQQLLGTDLSAGEGAGGQAAQDLGLTAEMQNKQDEDYQNSIAAAISSFSQMAGGNSIGSIEKLLGAS